MREEPPEGHPLHKQEVWERALTLGVSLLLSKGEAITWTDISTLIRTMRLAFCGPGRPLDSFLEHIVGPRGQEEVILIATPHKGESRSWTVPYPKSGSSTSLNQRGVDLTSIPERWEE